jgi:hypothetical protein
VVLFWAVLPVFAQAVLQKAVGQLLVWLGTTKPRTHRR